MIEIPEELLPALRQYRHNCVDEFVYGFDVDEIIKIFYKKRFTSSADEVIMDSSTNEE